MTTCKWCLKVNDPEKRTRHNDFYRNFMSEASVSLIDKGAVKQSSERLGGGEATRAVDGQTNTAWSSGSCTHTDPKGEYQPWWQV